MDHPNIRADLKRLDHAERIAPVPQGQFHHAGAETCQRLGNRRMAALGNGRQSIEQIVPRALRKILEVSQGRFHPANRAGVLITRCMVTNLPPFVKKRVPQCFRADRPDKPNRRKACSFNHIRVAAPPPSTTLELPGRIWQRVGHDRSGEGPEPCASPVSARGAGSPWRPIRRSGDR